MESYLFLAIGFLSMVVGIMGITIIFIGAVKALFEYLKSSDEDFQSARLMLGSHTILGLDFLVGKDIIDTLLLNQGEGFWMDLAGLGTVVTIRIVLTYFMLKEIRELKKKR